MYYKTMRKLLDLLYFPVKLHLHHIMYTILLKRVDNCYLAERGTVKLSITNYDFCGPRRFLSCKDFYLLNKTNTIRYSKIL